MTGEPLVLRSYASAESWTVALKLTELLFTPRYGNLVIDPNVPDSLPDGLDENGVRRWYLAVRKKIEIAPAVIALLTKDLALITPEQERGVGVLSELLAFWSVPQAADPAKLIFICVDCELEDLRSAPGVYEQLQDIIVPMARNSGTIFVDSELLVTSREAQIALADAVAARLGVCPVA